MAIDRRFLEISLAIRWTEAVSPVCTNGTESVSSAWMKKRMRLVVSEL